MITFIALLSHMQAMHFDACTAHNFDTVFNIDDLINMK